MLRATRAAPRALPKRPRLVFCDVDGTLVTKDKRLTPAVRGAVAALGERGIAFTIASARPPFGLAHVIEPLGIGLPVTSFNGGLVERPKGAALTRHPLPADVAREAAAALLAEGLEVWGFTNEHWLCAGKGGAYVDTERRTLLAEPTPVENFDAQIGQLGKIVGVSANTGYLGHCEAKLAARLEGRASVSRSQPYYLDITHIQATKSRALRAVASACGIALSDTIAIGDGHNDISMLQAAGVGIAMGNASESVRHAADYVTTSNEEDGVARAIMHILEHLDARSAAP